MFNSKILETEADTAKEKAPQTRMVLVDVTFDEDFLVEGELWTKSE
jgi:hypothetical protein